MNHTRFKETYRVHAIGRLRASITKNSEVIFIEMFRGSISALQKNAIIA